MVLFVKNVNCFNPLFYPPVSVRFFVKQTPLFQNQFQSHFTLKVKGKTKTQGVVPPHCFGWLSHPIVLGGLSQGGCPRGVVPERLFEPFLLEMISWLNHNI